MFCMVWVMRLDLNDVGVGSHGRQNDHGAYGPSNRMLGIVFNAVSNIKQRRIQSFNRMLELAKRVCRTSQQRASSRAQQTPETLPSCYNPIRWLLQRLVTYFPRTGQIRLVPNPSLSLMYYVPILIWLTNNILTKIIVCGSSGFMNRPLSACCGSGRPYNFSNGSQCGTKGVDCCIDPSKYVHWDGFHLTESAYRWVAMGLLEGPNALPVFDWSCRGFDIKKRSSSSGRQYAFNSKWWMIRVCSQSLCENKIAEE